METDLPGDGRFVLTERSGNSGLGRIVANTDLDDPSFIEGDVKMLIRRSHKRYLRSKRGIQIWTKIMIHAGRVNATCSSWRLNATLSPLELHLLFHFTEICFIHVYNFEGWTFYFISVIIIKLLQWYLTNQVRSGTKQP